MKNSVCKFHFRPIFPAFALLTFLLAVQCRAQNPVPPTGLSATPFERHIELNWTPSPDAGVSSYLLFRSTDGGASYTFLKQVYGNTNTFAIDWTGDEGVPVERYYTVRAFKNGSSSADSDPVHATTFPMDDDALLEMVQRSTFRYFWDFAHPVSGLAREWGNGDNNVVTTGGSGFGVMAIVVGAERGWVTRVEAVTHMNKIVSFLANADRFHGVFPHWMNGTNGNVIPFSQYDNGADLVETAFLIQGLLAARQYFDQNTPEETTLRAGITAIWEAVEWDWFRKSGGPVLYWHWSPNYGWTMNFPLKGFYEAQIVYILAAASPTHPVPGSLYQTGWTSNSNYCIGTALYGYPIYCGGFSGGPLFWAHYSYLGFDPRNWKDFCCNYFVRNRNHSLIQVNHAIDNPENHTGYGANCWGLTACNGPSGYYAHDIILSNDDGTVAPTAALSSMPYVPAESKDALRHFYRDLGDKIYGRYGFYDAFNLDVNWVAPSYLAIDQGPVVAMIENYRTGLLWEKFMQNPEIEPALLACGFVPDNSGLSSKEGKKIAAAIFPNPVEKGRFKLEFELSSPEELNISIVNLEGAVLKTVCKARRFDAGRQSVPVECPELQAGVYFVYLETGSGSYNMLQVQVAEH